MDRGGGRCPTPQLTSPISAWQRPRLDKLAVRRDEVVQVPELTPIAVEKTNLPTMPSRHDEAMSPARVLGWWGGVVRQFG